MKAFVHAALLKIEDLEPDLDDIVETLIGEGYNSMQNLRTLCSKEGDGQSTQQELFLRRDQLLKKCELNEFQCHVFSQALQSHPETESKKTAAKNQGQLRVSCACMFMYIQCMICISHTKGMLRHGR